MVLAADWRAGPIAVGAALKSQTVLRRRTANTVANSSTLNIVASSADSRDGNHDRAGQGALGDPQLEHYKVPRETRDNVNVVSASPLRLDGALKDIPLRFLERLQESRPANNIAIVDWDRSSRRFWETAQQMKRGQNRHSFRSCEGPL